MKKNPHVVQLIVLTICIFFALSALATDRTHLMVGEACAFEAIFGTSKISELTDIEKDPAAFWARRRQALFSGPNQLLTHVAFCTKFAREAQERIAELLRTAGDSPWFANFTHVNSIIKKYFNKSEPLFHTAIAAFYGAICDHAYCRSKRPEMATPEGFERALRNWGNKCGPDVSHAFNAKCCWQILPSGKFSLFDCLVAREQGLYLSAIPTRYIDRHTFMAHNGQFWGWLGLITHDCLTHSLGQHKLEGMLATLHICYQEQFSLCCNPKTLMANNIIILSRQVQGHFYHNHEIPGGEYEFRAENPLSLLFPTTDYLLDDGFMLITPYFIEKDDYPWRQRRLSYPQKISQDSVHDTLLSWRDEYCAASTQLLQYVPAHIYTPPATQKHTHDACSTRAPHRHGELRYINYDSDTEPCGFVHVFYTCGGIEMSAAQEILAELRLDMPAFKKFRTH